MRDTVTPSQMYSALQTLLGLPAHCVSFELSVRPDTFGVTVTCEHYVALDVTGLKQLEAVFSEYELVSRAPLADITSAQVMGFDAWMRERTERAHREFMARTAAT